MGRTMKEVIQKILKRWADDDVNLQSEAAREVLAKELTHELLRYQKARLTYRQIKELTKEL